MFGKLKNKLGMALARKQMTKAGVPQEQQEKLINMMTEKPELMQQIEKEIKHQMAQGKGQQAAAMEVMKKYKDELQGLMM